MCRLTIDIIIGVIAVGLSAIEFFCAVIALILFVLMIKEP